MAAPTVDADTSGPVPGDDAPVEAIADAEAVGLSAEKAREQAEAASRPVRRFVTWVLQRSGFTTSGLVLLAVVVLSWLLARVVAGKPLYLLAYGCGVVLLAFRFVLFRAQPAVTGTRGAAVARVVAGQTVPISVTLTAERNVSTLLLEERLPILLGQSANIAVPELGAGESVEHHYSVTAWRRGVYPLGPLVVRWGDPFGLTQREAQLAEPFELLVHPRVEPLTDRPLTRMWEDPPMRPPISKPWPSGAEFYGMRPYVPGDDVRKIVWRAYARTRELLVREAEQGISDKVVILLDNDERFHSRGVISDSFETAVRAAASIGTHHLDQGYVVTLDTNSGRKLTALRAGPARTLMLDEMARAELGRDALAPALTRLLADGQRDAHLLIVTPFLQADAAARLELLMQRGVQVTVVALVWEEEHTVALAKAAALGAQVVEIRDGTPFAVAFRREVGGTHA
jgi:uncharacterized protein (DUF58 family)